MCPEPGEIVEPAMVEEAVELRLRNSLQLKGNIVTQLEEGFEAAVRDELRGIKTAAEQAPAVSAHFGHQQRGHGVLSIGGDQRRECCRGCNRCRDSVNSILLKSTRPL